ncbi:MAG: ABC transporter ATP-binding protein [Mycoplasmatales bacterium]|nr:ABC transporter ATP-binding protein [Mycoplasmatales bacterium]
MKKLKLVNKWSILYFLIAVSVGFLASTGTISLKYTISFIEKDKSILIPMIIFAISVTLWIISLISSFYVERKLEIYYEKIFKDQILNYYIKQNAKRFNNSKFENDFIFNSNKIVKEHMISKVIIVSKTVSSLIVLIAIFLISLEMVPILIFLIALRIVLNHYLKNKTAKINMKNSENRKKYSVDMSDLLLGYDDASSVGKISNLNPKFLKTNKKYSDRSKKIIKNRSIIAFFKNFSTQFLDMGVWTSLAIFAYFKIISLPEFVTFISITTLFQNFVEELFSAIYNFSSTKKLKQSFFSEINSEKNISLEKVFPIKTKNISFKDKENLFKYKDIKILENDKVFLKGSNGSGKSLLLKILLDRINFEGEVFFDGKKINSRTISNFSYYLSTKAMILDSSIKHNILLKDGEIEKKFIDKYSFIFNNFPDLNKNAEELSHGQKQMICLLRVLYRNPQLIIIDEGLSGVDKNNLFAIENLLSQNSMAVIYVSHQANTDFKYNKLIKREKNG